MGDFFKKHKEIILYVVFGIITTVLSWGLYALFANALKMSVFASSAVSWIIVITVAFITNKLFVFESKAFNLKVLLKEASSFLASRAATGVSSSGAGRSYCVSPRRAIKRAVGTRRAERIECTGADCGCPGFTPPRRRRSFVSAIKVRGCNP